MTFEGLSDKMSPGKAKSPVFSGAACRPKLLQTAWAQPEFRTPSYHSQLDPIKFFVYSTDVPIGEEVRTERVPRTLRDAVPESVPGCQVETASARGRSSMIQQMHRGSMSCVTSTCRCVVGTVAYCQGEKNGPTVPPDVGPVRGRAGSLDGDVLHGRQTGETEDSQRPPRNEGANGSIFAPEKL